MDFGLDNAVFDLKLGFLVLLKVAEICLAEFKVGLYRERSSHVLVLIETQDRVVSVLRLLDRLADDVAAVESYGREGLGNDARVAGRLYCRHRIVQVVSELCRVGVLEFRPDRLLGSDRFPT